MIPIRPRYSHWLPRLLRVQGIVLYPYVLFSPPREEVHIVLWQHEMIHVRQVRRYGWVGFYLRYVAEYFSHRRRGFSRHRAYRRISFEREAYRLAQRQELTALEKKEAGLA